MTVKKFILLLHSAFCILHCTSLQAQNPYVKVWDKRFGGNLADGLSQILETSDGGYLLGGYSNSSISGDKTENNRDTGCIGGCTSDYWIVKTDSLGNKQWDKTFGGADNDQLKSVQQTSDGGYIIGGVSQSGIGFDKSQNTQGLSDYWILKTDALGNKVWDKNFGSTNYDILYFVLQTADGGYLIGGDSKSGIGGDKSQANQGGYDYWILKVDANGTKQWDKTFGGTDADYLSAAIQNPDQGYVLSGYSLSGIGGDKSQPNWGMLDYWVIRIDSLGNKIWDKDFGGNDIDLCFSMCVAPDGNYILAGTSTSDISGNKTQPLWGGFGDHDLWILKIDSLGNILWDKDLGGNYAEDELGNVSITSDGGILIGANSYSYISGNKSENNLGSEQSWIIKTDSLGNHEWDRTAFTMGHDETGFVIETRDGCYLLGNYTTASIGGYKTQANWDSTLSYDDYWIVKFCDSTFLYVGISTVDQTLCPGTCTDFLSLSLNATSFLWNFQGAIPNMSTAANPSNICYNTPGVFDVTLIASNAVSSDTLSLPGFITVYPQPPPQSIMQNGDTLFANAGAVGYQWYFNNTLIPGATNSYYVAPASGDYNVVATDINGCEVEAVINNVIAAVGSPDSYRDMQSIQIYPNPVTETLIVKCSMPALLTTGSAGLTGTAAEVSIYNVMGEKIYSADYYSGINREQLTINCKLFPSGLYYLEIITAGKTHRAKFIKE